MRGFRELPDSVDETLDRHALHELYAHESASWLKGPVLLNAFASKAERESSSFEPRLLPSVETFRCMWNNRTHLLTLTLQLVEEDPPKKDDTIEAAAKVPSSKRKRSSVKKYKIFN